MSAKNNLQFKLFLFIFVSDPDNVDEHEAEADEKVTDLCNAHLRVLKKDLRWIILKISANNIRDLTIVNRRGRYREPADPFKRIAIPYSFKDFHDIFNDYFHKSSLVLTPQMISNFFLWTYSDGIKNMKFCNDPREP